MHRMQLFRNPLVILLLVYFFFATYAPAYAQESILKALIHTSDFSKPNILLTNTSTTPCQIVQSALGTIAITKVVQDGKVISPIAITVAFDEGLDVVLAKKLLTLKPGQTTEIPLKLFRYKSGYALQSITWSHDAGAFGVLYPLQPNKPYFLEGTYTVPLMVTGTPPCGIASWTNVPAPSDTSIIIKVGVMIILAIVLIVLFVWLLRSKKRRKTVVTALLIGSFLVTGIQPVQADYSIPSSIAPQFDDCMAILNAHTDITGPVLDALDGQHIVIDATTDGTNDTTSWPDGSFHIAWDATNTYNYYSDDGTTIVSTPCDRLFHEMYHVFDMLNGTFSRDFCDGSAIETKEVMAVRAQNRLRVALGLKPRTHYGHDRLPTGSCTPPHVNPISCRGGCGETNGDPHLLTFDKLRYDFQAAGEFVVARDKKGDFEVQARQQPWADSRYVSINTAVAMRVGEDRVEIQMKNQKMVLLINGKTQPLITTSLKNGAITLPDTNNIVVTWLDGSTVSIDPIGTFGLSLLIDPVSVRAGTLEGLLGNFNGDSKDDLKSKTGSIDPTFENLYPAFADTWRITDTSSLFTYDQGKNTETYTDHTFPDKYNPMDLSNRATAEKLCQAMGVTDPAILENCIIDVALTGRPEFARAAKNGQQISKSASTIPNNFVRGTNKGTIIPDKGDAFATIDKPGETAAFTFTGQAGQYVFLDIPATTLPNQCGGIGIRAADGQNISSGCIVDSKGYSDTNQLPVTGTYTVFVEPADNRMGQTTLRLLLPNIDKSSIIINGPAVTTKLDKPGSFAKLTFSGNAGQRVFVEIISTTLSDQCGGFYLSGADDSPLDSGCIIDHKGSMNEQGVILPKSGIYTITIDPVDRNIGTATVRVH